MEKSPEKRAHDNAALTLSRPSLPLERAKAREEAAAASAAASTVGARLGGLIKNSLTLFRPAFPRRAARRKYFSLAAQHAVASSSSPRTRLICERGGEARRAYQVFFGSPPRNLCLDCLNKRLAGRGEVERRKTRGNEASERELSSKAHIRVEGERISASVCVPARFIIRPRRR